MTLQPAVIQQIVTHGGSIMFSQEGLLAWYQRLAMSQPSCRLLDSIRSSGPSRRVRSGRLNVCGRYPSQKMGMTIQFESHRVELAAIYEMEYDKDVLEYYDQPPPIKLDYKSRWKMPRSAAPP